MGNDPRRRPRNLHAFKFKSWILSNSLLEPNHLARCLTYNLTKGCLPEPPHPLTPLPQGGQGRVDFPALAPLGERVAALRRRVRGSLRSLTVRTSAPARPAWKNQTLANGYYFVLALTLALSLAVPARSQQISRVERGDALEMLDQIAHDVQKHYYDPTFHGVDWRAKVIETREKIRGASSFNMLLAYIAASLDSLGDSHTFFFPPLRPTQCDYGFRTEMVGTRCYIARVRPGSDAAAKGIKPGDEVQTLEGWVPSREILWNLDYRYTVLRPQTGLRLVLTNPQGLQRQVDVFAKLEKINRIAELSSFAGDINMDTLRRTEDEAKLSRPRTAEVGESLLIIKIPEFLFDPLEMDKMIGKARKHSALIIDLRDNPGGTGQSLKFLAGRIFDRDVKIADRSGRKAMNPLIAPSVGRRAFLGKLVVLVNSQSASASELFARTVQLEKRGLVLGDRTSGRVMEARDFAHSVGQEMVIPYGISLTEADLIMSDGKSLEHSGVVPDEIVLPTAHDMANAQDPALSRAAVLLGAKLSPADAGKLFPFEWPKQ